MKVLVSFTILLAMAVLMTGSDVSAPAIYIGHDKVMHTFSKRGHDNDGVIASSPIRVSGNLRTGPGEAEVHENEIDVFYVVDGGSTMVAGGTMVAGKKTAPGQIKGTGIQGGQTYHLTKGDVMIIPAGTPHWHQDVSPSIAYYTVKVPRMAGIGMSTDAVYVGHEKVAHTFAKQGPDNDGQIAKAPVRLVGSLRSGPGIPEVHENAMDVFWVMDGSSTIVTGGTLLGSKMASPGELQGTGVQGGKAQLFTKGDVMIVPAGTPHWYKDVPKSITYFTVKVPKK